MPNLMDVNTKGVQISASTTSASAAIPLLGATTMRVYNPSGATCYVTTDTTAPTATSANMPVGASPEVFSVNPGHSFVAVILSTGTGTIDIRFSVGGE